MSADLRPGSLVLETRDVVLLAAFTLVYFCGAVAAIACAVSSGFGALLFPSFGDNRNGDSAPQVGITVIFVAIIVLIVLATTLTVSALAALVAAPLAGLLAIALRRIRPWPIHLGAYFVLGALVAIPIAVFVVDPLLSGFILESSPSLPTIVGAMLLAGSSTAAGWATAWRLAERNRRRRAEPSRFELAA